MGGLSETYVAKTDFEVGCRYVGAIGLERVAAYIVHNVIGSKLLKSAQHSI